MENVGLNFGFIGTGQCGGNIANEFAKLGYKAIAINTSATDWGKLENIHESNKLLIDIDGIEGAGKNTEIGEQALGEHIEEIMHLIDQVFDDKTHVYVVCAGFGGGTGSAIAPILVQILVEQGRNVCSITTLPSNTESDKSKIISLGAYENLSRVEGMGSVFTIDNAKANLPSQMGLRTKYGVVNENMAIKLHQLNKMTTYVSDIAFDARDFFTLINTRGYSIITSSLIGDIAEIKESEVLAQSVRKALKNSIFADTSYELAKGCAFLFELPEGGSNFLNEEAIYKMQKELGSPFETFMGVYENKNKKREVTLHIFVVGLPFPFERLTKIDNEIKEKEEKIQNQFTTSQQQTFTSNSKALLGSFNNSIIKKESVKTEGESTLDKLLKKKK